MFLEAILFDYTSASSKTYIHTFTSFIPTKEVNGELVPKEWDQMKDDEKRKVQDDKN